MSSSASPSTPLVSVIMGSLSDHDALVKCRKTLDSLGISHEAKILSAHRTPDELVAYVGGLEKQGTQVVIAAAGMAAHLAGVVSAHTTLPVIGVPLSGGISDGLDALLSTVQMPRGIPVATVAVNGSANAAVLAVEMLSITDSELAKSLETFRDAGAR